MKRYYSLCFWVLFLFEIVSCQPRDKFNWNAGFSAPKNYVAGGSFVEYFYKGKSIAGTSSSVGIYPGWGINSGGYTGGDIYKDVPDSIVVSWTCGFDMINYRGGFRLPREKMLNLFKEKTTEPYSGRKVDYSLIVAGMAPGGNVTIWMQGAQTNKEIAKFKAKEISKDNRYDENSITLWTSTGEEAKNILKYIKIHGIPYSAWEKGEKEYNYDIGFSSKEDNKFEETITSISKDGSYIFFNRDESIVSYQDWQNNNFKPNVKKKRKIAGTCYITMDFTR